MMKAAKIKDTAKMHRERSRHRSRNCVKDRLRKTLQVLMPVLK